MNPWLRVLAVFGVAIAAALFLKVLPPVIVLVFFIGGIAWVNLSLRRRVKTERAGFRDEAIGLKREAQDPFGLIRYPFALFFRCEDASVEDVRWGTWRGLDIKRFDLSCFTRSGERARFACAIGPAPPVLVPFVVEARLWGTLLGDPPFEDVDVGSTDAERTFVVRCGDPAFARRLVGPAMLSWLDGLEEPWGFEVQGSLALVYGPPSVSGDEPLERLQAFTDLVASAVPPAAKETVPNRPDAMSPDDEGLGERGDAS